MNPSLLMGAPFCWSCSYPCAPKPTLPQRPRAPTEPKHPRWHAPGTSPARPRRTASYSVGGRSSAQPGHGETGRRVGDLVLSADQLDLAVATGMGELHDGVDRRGGAA